MAVSPTLVMKVMTTMMMERGFMPSVWKNMHGESTMNASLWKIRCWDTGYNIILLCTLFTWFSVTVSVVSLLGMFVELRSFGFALLVQNLENFMLDWLAFFPWIHDENFMLQKKCWTTSDFKEWGIKIFLNICDSKLIDKSSAIHKFVLNFGCCIFTWFVSHHVWSRGKEKYYFFFFWGFWWEVSLFHIFQQASPLFHNPWNFLSFSIQTSWKIFCNFDTNPEILSLFPSNHPWKTPSSYNIFKGY